MAEQILQVEHLEKFYQKKHVLHDINFHVEKGEVVTLLGPSGSGKSTLIRCLNGLEEYQQGTITFEGKQIVPTEKNWQQIRQRLGWYFKATTYFQICRSWIIFYLGRPRFKSKPKRRQSKKAWHF